MTDMTAGQLELYKATPDEIVRTLKWLGKADAVASLLTTPQPASGSSDVDEIAAVYTDRDDDLCPDNAALIVALRNNALALLDRIEAAEADARRLDYIERTFSGMTNRERYLPVQMVWGNGANGRTLREACDKYMKRDAAMAQEASGG